MPERSSSQIDKKEKLSSGKSSSILGFLFLGCLLLLIGLIRFLQYKATGQVSHERFGFAESGWDALVPIFAATIAGAVSLFVAFVIYFKGRKTSPTRE